MRGTINGVTLTACAVGFESRPKGFEPFEFLEGLTGLTGFDNCAILPTNRIIRLDDIIPFFGDIRQVRLPFCAPTIKVNGEFFSKRFRTF